MKIKCYKYHGAGNDFVIVDNRDGSINLTQPQVKFLCDRRFGIGADGLMLLGLADGYDFSMKYYNSDGYEGTMCGNGGRCITAFAAKCGIKKYSFIAIDAPHSSTIEEDLGNEMRVRLKMNDVSDIVSYPDNKFFINTGSPHLVIFPENFEDTDVDKEGRYWRHHSSFPGGTNVNFVKAEGSKLVVRTFERGVEAETLACGTGVTASVIAYEMLSRNDFYGNSILRRNGKGYKAMAEVRGGSLEVEFETCAGGYTNIFLTGPATFVFECTIEI